ncbi:MAG: Flp pilus assembly complex ATPase component TadA [Chloroflexi bacterium]|nr:Flp pilus assembly complex ATPase component TadA [Chloroflexota bacterium]
MSIPDTEEKKQVESGASALVTENCGYKSFLDILHRQGVVTEEEVKKLSKKLKVSKEPIDHDLIEKGIPKEQILQAKAAEYGIECVDIENDKPDIEMVKLIPESMSRRYKLICIGKKESKLSVVMADPSDIFALDDLRLRTGYEIQPFLGFPDDIDVVLNEIYRVEELESIMKDALAEKSDDLAITSAGKEEEEEQDAVVDTPIIRFVDRLIIDAIKRKASDIHIEPYETEVIVRYRVDGILNETMKYPRSIHNSVISRLKIMSNMKIDEHRIPQDGRVQIKLGKSRKEFDIRVSLLPSVYSETIVMRLLDRSGIKIDLEQIGFQEDDLNRWKSVIANPNGVILVTGPTGSGKSTTLYATLNRLNRPEVKIVTVEDPVEYNLQGLVQIQTNSRVGLTFAAALRSFLRQDPDIMMVGEIRDKETATIAIESALTGHLVLSTLHTNDSVASITRLEDMGIETFLIASTIRGILAQRLVRKICSDCKQEAPLSPEEKNIFEEYGISPPDHVMKGGGCQTCTESGYKGRMGIYELLTINDKIRELILKRESAANIYEEAKKDGLRTLMEDGLAKIKNGDTTFEEVFRVTKD